MQLAKKLKKSSMDFFKLQYFIFLSAQGFQEVSFLDGIACEILDHWMKKSTTRRKLVGERNQIQNGAPLHSQYW